MVLETKRLILRNWKMEDAESMFLYAKDKEVGPICGWPPHESIETSKMVLASFIEKPNCFAICKKEDIDNPIGCIELMNFTTKVRNNNEAELGYWLGRPFWGLGYMPEAASRLIEYGFNELGLNLIWCSYFSGNNKSKRVQEKLGFKYHHTGPEKMVESLNEIRCEEINYLTKEEFLKKNN